eukprot:m.45232 g.45232  ORF g.45232 m.45232 type:complete len:542 (+) comp10218_c1_seq1:53-1678(+)
MATNVYLLDYGAGNVRSVANAVKAVGGELKLITSPEDFDKADKLIFPGVGSFGACMEKLIARGYMEKLKEYILSGRPYLGICIGLQALFEASEESPDVAGLGILKGTIKRFDVAPLSVPHIGWNGINVRKSSNMLSPDEAAKYYFVHSYMAPLEGANIPEYVLATTDYGSKPFISAIQKEQCIATQFHPEKSGKAGLELIRKFLAMNPGSSTEPFTAPTQHPTQLAARVIACLDVRGNDAGDLVVTKGDQYDVRESSDTEKKGDVRNLGKPVALAKEYYEGGADEVTFLNITSFRNSPLKDQPMLEVLRQTSCQVFVPLTIGGGIRDIVNPDGTKLSALEVAGEYFRSGADKVSIGSDAVLAAEEYLSSGKKSGNTSIETISHVYGAQAVVISVDPRRVYVESPTSVKHTTIETKTPGPNGEKHCWYQCTIKGGREGRDIGAHELAVACEALGAGEILLNCIDKDGTNSGFDLELINDIKNAVTIPVIASSGAGSAQHFLEVFQQTKTDAALAAGIFHRKEVPISEVKSCLKDGGVCTRGY